MTSEEFKDKFPRTDYARKVRQYIDARHYELMQKLRVATLSDFQQVQAKILECEYMLALLCVDEVNPDTSR